MTTTAPVHAGYERGTAAYGRLGAAMWCAGLATFVLVYCVQALLPTLAVEFGVSSSAASLALSATTGTLALAIVPLSAVAESWGRARVMTAALAASAVLGVLAPLAPTFGTLIAVRALQGVALAALPALAMAHVTREVAPRWLGGAVGLLIAGNTIGGLSGRLVAGAVADMAGWRVALAVIGVLSLLCTVAFRLLLPPALAPAPPRVRLRELGVPLRAQLSDPGLCCLFGIAFLLPNTQEWTGYIAPNTDRVDAVEPSLFGRFAAALPRWRPTLVQGSLLGAVLCWCLLAAFAETPSEFLYFQF